MRHKFVTIKALMAVIACVFAIGWSLSPLTSALADDIKADDIKVDYSVYGFAIHELALMGDLFGTEKIVVEVANTPSQRAQGLMKRESLAPFDGMLFVWPDRALRHFWMKDTPLSLDILFFDETGTLFHHEDRTTPYSERLIPSLMPAKYVLELPAGTRAKWQFEIGDRITPLF